jgi:hypothetical protein
MRRSGPGRDTEPDARTRVAVYARDGYACVCCGTPIDGRPHSVGLRKRPRHGGTTEMTNLLTFLGLGTNPLDPGDHHARIDSRGHLDDQLRGYFLYSRLDPAEVPVMIFSPYGSPLTVWLTEAGGYAVEPPEVRACLALPRRTFPPERDSL